MVPFVRCLSALVAVATFVACAAPPVPAGLSSASSKKDADDEDDDEDKDDEGTDDETNASPRVTADPSDPGTTELGAASGTGLACLQQCVASLPAAASYLTCAIQCQDETCDGQCFQTKCGTQADACDQTLRGCDAQCAGSGTTTNPGTPAGDPQQCMDTCARRGVTLQYWQCGDNCQDQQCDEQCWNQFCGGTNAQACEQQMMSCESQCGASL